MAMTGPDGRYVLASLRPGRRNTLHYSDCADPGRYLDQWSGGASWPGGAASETVAASRVKTLAIVTLRSVMRSGCRLAPLTKQRAKEGWTPAELASAGLTAGQARAMLSPATPVTGKARGAISGRVTGDRKALGSVCVEASAAAPRKR